MRTKTVCIQIGNSDNKLTQEEWSNFVNGVRYYVKTFSVSIFFDGSSPNDAPWQNHALIFGCDLENYHRIREHAIRLRKQFKQDSVALLEGDTEFI